MATLETQYKNFLLENPKSKLTFDEWKEWLGKQLEEALKDILEYADGKSVLNPNFDREGVVIRSLDRKISFKAISNKFLLNEK
jgi:hypothetical protein